MAKSNKKTTSKSRAKSKARTSSRAVSSLSPERNLTLGGLLLTGLGVITALGLFSGQSTNLLAAVQSLLRKGFGWGAYALPLLLLGTGLLILLRKMENAPKLSTEQSIGISLLYLAVLTTLQFFTFPVDFAASTGVPSAPSCSARSCSVLRSTRGGSSRSSKSSVRPPTIRSRSTTPRAAI